ncbi:MAG: DUF1259 domain-containing protein [Acidobacteriota bacterium]|nr:DUF1259 domain-containing protein [Acidobacteriota bacterium]
MLKAILAIALLPAVSALAAEPWQSVDTTLKQTGKAVAGNVHRYGFPRRDLKVTIARVRLEPPLALGSWAAFSSDMVMGDLVLLPKEVEPVLRTLQYGGMEITAIHNHLLDESPPIAYVHYEGHGDPAALARTLQKALATTATPMTPAEPVTPDKKDEAAFTIVSGILQRQGTNNGRVLQFGIPRAETIAEEGVTIPPTMGVATAVNFQRAGDKVATTGDFVLIASEVNPVIKDLEAHGIRVTAVHSHMLGESPRLFFLHFWGLGAPKEIADGIRAALAKTNVAK